MIFFIYGTDNYRCQEKLNELKDGFIQKRDKAGLNIVNLDGEKLGLDELRQEILTVPFLGEKKMIVIKNFLGGRKPSENTKAEEFLSTNEKTLENVVCFVEFFDPKETRLSRGHVEMKNALFKFLAGQKFAWEFNALSNRELTPWLKQYTEKNQIKIEPAALTALAAAVGNDLYQLTSELKKLKAYRHPGAIKAEDIKNLAQPKFNDNIFNLMDAIGQKNRKLSLKLISDQLSSGNHELMLHKMILRQFKILLQIAGGATAANSDLHPFVYQKAKLQAKNFSLVKLKKIYTELLGLEAEFKTGQKNPELIFDLFIAKNC